MAIETLFATGHITGTVATPDSALGNTPSTWAGVVNANTSATSRWAIGDPVDPLTADQSHTVRVVARKGSNSGTPTVALNLYENGTLVQSIVGATGVSSTTGQDVQGTFATSVITDRTAIEVEVVIAGASGNPSTRNSAQISLVELTADTTAAAAETDVNPAPAAVEVVAGTAAITGQADVSPAPTAVATMAGTIAVTGHADLAPSATVVTAVATVADVTGEDGGGGVGASSHGGIDLVQADVVGLTATPPADSASFTWEDGDLFIVVGATAHSSGAWAAPTATGLTFSTIDTATTGSWGWARSWQATASGSGSDNITIPGPAGAFFGAVCYQWRDHGGVGDSGAVSGGSTTTVSLTVADDSAVVYLGMDEAAGAPGQTLTPSSPTPTERADATATNITWHVGDWVGVGAGTTGYGNGDGGGNWFQVAVEVLVAAGGGTDVNPVATVVTVVAATGNVGGQADVNPGAAVVASRAAVANVGAQADIAPVATAVTVVAFTADVTGTASVTPTGTSVTTAAATGNVSGQADIAPSSTVVAVVSAVGNVSGTNEVEPVSTVVTVVTATAAITGQADVAPSSTVVTVVSAVADVESTVLVSPASTVVTVVAAVADITGTLTINPTGTVVNVVSGQAAIGGQADIAPVATVFAVFAAVAQIAIGIISPVFTGRLTTSRADPPRTTSSGDTANTTSTTGQARTTEAVR
jgi:hypothetical protein